MSLAVANQYAKALLEVVSDPAAGISAEEALSQLDEFSNLLGTSSELRTTFDSPAVGLQQKRNVLSRLGESAGTHPLVRNFLAVVVQKRRLGLLAEMRGRFQALLDEKLGIVRAHVVSAKALPDAVRTALQAEVERMTGRNVRFDSTVDAALVGGVTVRVGSVIYDGSIRGQLAALRRRLTSEV